MAVNPTIKITYEDYKSFGLLDRDRYELLEGGLYMVPSPTFDHQYISYKLGFELGKFVLEYDLGIVVDAPLDVVLGPSGDESIVQPDIIFISKARSKIIRHEEIRGAPDLVIEILSPTTSQRDRRAKKALYARSGVTEYWIVDPDTQSIEVYKLTARGYRLVHTYSKKETLLSPLLPGLEIPLKKIFQR